MSCRTGARQSRRGLRFVSSPDNRVPTSDRPWVSPLRAHTPPFFSSSPARARPSSFCHPSNSISVDGLLPLSLPLSLSLFLDAPAHVDFFAGARQCIGLSLSLSACAYELFKVLLLPRAGESFIRINLLDGVELAEGSF